MKFYIHQKLNYFKTKNLKYMKFNLLVKKFETKIIQ